MAGGALNLNPHLHSLVPDGLFVLDPVKFLKRLTALMARPYANLVRYHGVFANRPRRTVHDWKNGARTR